jgi:hypothetical protein
VSELYATITPQEAQAALDAYLDVESTRGSRSAIYRTHAILTAAKGDTKSMFRGVLGDAIVEYANQVEPPEMRYQDAKEWEKGFLRWLFKQVSDHSLTK